MGRLDGKVAVKDRGITGINPPVAAERIAELTASQAGEQPLPSEVGR